MIYNGIEGILTIQKSAFNAFDFKLLTSWVSHGGNL